MNRLDTAKCYALVAAAYGLTASETTIEAWHALMSDLDGPTALEATRQLCRRDSQWPPRPGEIIGLAGRLTGCDAPPIEAAVGYYVGGQWDAHPLIERCAKAVYFDRHVMPKEAVFEFRNRYSAALYDEETGTVRRDLAAIEGDAAPLTLGEAGEEPMSMADSLAALRRLKESRKPKEDTA